MEKYKYALFAISPIDSSFLNRVFPEVEVIRKNKEISLAIFLLVPFQQFIGKNLISLKKFIFLWEQKGVKIFILPVKFYQANPLIQLMTFPLRLLALLFFLLRFRPKVIHAHSIEAGFLAAMFKRLFGYRLILELHGEVIEEIRMRRFQKMKLLALMFVEIEEFISLRIADGIIYASKVLREYIETKYSHNKRSIILPYNIFPKKFDWYWQRRLMMRKKLSLDNKFVVVYSGGFYDWQTVANLSSIFRVLRKLIDNICLLVLTFQSSKEIKRSLIQGGINIHDFLIKNLPLDETMSVLPVADLGLHIRKKGIASWVVSPSKFPEYLICGVPVLSTYSTEQVVDILKVNKSCGYLFNENFEACPEIFKDEKPVRKFVSKIIEHRKMIALQAYKIAVKNFNWEQGKEKLFRFLEMENETSQI